MFISRVFIMFMFVYLAERKDNGVNLQASRMCKPDLPLTLSDGYWLKGEWISLYCKNRYFSPSHIGNCLKNKIVYFLGDSTLLQWHKYLVDLLHAEGPPRGYVVKSFNISLNFNFHKITIHRSSTNWEGQYRYEVDVIDGIRDKDCNFIVILGPAFHFVQWSKDALIERLVHLRSAIFRLHENCPNVPVIIKTPHPYYEGYHGELICIATSDYLVFEIRKLILQIFNETDVFVVDAWDLNLAYPAPNVIHMPKGAIEAELSMFLSYTCSAFHKA